VWWSPTHNALVGKHKYGECFDLIEQDDLGWRDTEELSELPADAVRLYPGTWAGLLQILDDHYPADIFVGGDTADPGPRIVALSREVARLRGIEKRAREVKAAVPEPGKAAGPVVLKRAAARYILGEDTPDADTR
jgi:hypothetical protein